jgi:hypothetical protein
MRWLRNLLNPQTTNPTASPTTGATVSADFISRPERPIQESKDDRLSRAPFIQRLTNALIDSSAGRSTGIVIGITGQWGAGKSSILNLLRTHIAQQYPDAVVISFDPWLISGRNDLISQFLAELLKALQPRPGVVDKAKGIADVIADYGDTLAPALNLVHPGIAFAGNAGTKGLRALTKTDKSLAGLKRKLEDMLAKTERPIIVLIDELDRVEDDEIRSVAQLVRSVADFPSISYVLAYDPHRVIQALGHGASGDDVEKRGSAYLEKIVQLQIPLPVIFGDELVKLLNAELEKLAPAQGMPADFQNIERYQELTNMLLAGTLQTPRDISRLVGTFHALAGMVGNEVDRIDLLGYSALVAKSPRTVQKLRDNTEEFTDDIVSAAALLRRMDLGKRSAEQRLKDALPRDGDHPGTGNLLKFLFPVFQDRSRPTMDSPDRLSYRRPLLTALRLGLIPGTYTQQEIEQLLKGSPEFVAESFQKAFADDSLAALIDRIDDIYSTFSGTHHIDFWKGVAEFVRKPDCVWPSHYDPMHSLLHDIAGLLERAIQRNPAMAEVAPRIFTNLRHSDDVLTALWLRSHIFRHNLFGQTNQGDKVTFLTAEQTKTLAIEFSQEMRGKQVTSNFIPCRYDLQPVYTMVDTGHWDTKCQEVLAADLENGPALDGFTLMLYGGNYSTGKSTIEKIIPYDFFIKKVKGRIESPEFASLHESVKVALKKALDPH